MSASTAIAGERRLAHLPYKWVALGVVLLGTIMTILDSTIVNIAIRSLQTDFHVASYSDVTWVVTGYLLAQGAVIPLSGWATDRWGTKRLYLATIFLFTMASAACGVAGSLNQLILFRVFQGLGGGMLMPIGMTIILRAVGPRQMGRVMGMFGIPMLLAPAIGPVLGGWFVQDFTWRLIFYVNVPIGIAAFAAAFILLVETPRTGKLRLDYVGLLTAVPAVLALMYAVDRSTDLGWSSPLVIGLLIFSVISFAVFIFSQLSHRFRRDEPLLHLELFSDSTFRASMILSFIVVTAMFGGMLLLPLFLQQVHGFDPIHTALFLLPQAATAAIAMPLGGYLSDRIGPRWVVMTGLVLLGIASLMLTNLQPGTGTVAIVIPLALRGFAMGFAMMPAMAAALARIPRQLTSRASSITNSMQRVSSSIGIAILVTFLVAQITVATQQATCNPSLAAQTQAGQGHVVPAQALCASLGNAITSEIKNQNITTATAPGALGTFATTFANNALSIAFDRTFGLIAILCGLGLIPAFFLKRPDAAQEQIVAVEVAA